VFKVEVQFDFHFNAQMQAWGPAKYRYISNKLHGLILRKDTHLVLTTMGKYLTYWTEMA